MSTATQQPGVTLAQDAPATTFDRRHIGPSPRDIEEMLKIVDAESLEQLISQTVPDSIRLNQPLAFPPALSETEALVKIKAVAAKNTVFTSLIGAGYYGTVLPPVILRNILENPAWYTAYTPYQPEISQGRLEALLNFQTLITDLTGLDIANASLLDEATAAAEAMALARRVSNKPETAVFFVDRQVHPQTLAVLKTRAEAHGWNLVVGEPEGEFYTQEMFGAILQYPATYGEVRDLRGPIASIHAHGGLAVVAADPLALCLLASPAEMGADIAIGSTQRFGVPMGFGGPHAAYMAVKDAYKRSMPGRLVGVSVDARGTKALRLALQTREQHIRRQSATSNICTAQVLLAVIASMYAVYHGPEGLSQIAADVHRKATVLASGLKKLGFKLLTKSYFDTVTVSVSEKLASILDRCKAEKINLRVVNSGEFASEAALGISLDEATTPAVIEAVWKAFGGSLSFDAIAVEVEESLPAALLRKTAYLQHPVFHRYRSETEILRYMRKLSDRDLALDRSMIPLGSCTMKLNATAEMIPITWSEFAELHPFVPAEQAQGYHEMFAELNQMLCEVTGYDQISLQPNSGAQGEYAGLMAIRGYHKSRGESHRNICLIPASAHGTNPASAAMAGMEVVVVSCDANGNVDLDDVRAKAEQYKDKLAAIMITYPSTHGVFEEHVREIADAVHACGGQVYVDGANLNAQVGLARPGDYGSDVSHLNLHKTFCIPHGGGGPGMGPIGVKAHLAPFLPAHPLEADTAAVGPVSAAPYGSASILPISYAYMLMMGSEGLKKASEMAVLNANYIAARLESSFPVLYKNEKGRVAHECIIDPRELKNSSGVTVDDIAKRLVDYGFHAPTMSFPVAGTLMIEPTESESKEELDRFCDAMINIRKEIQNVQDGKLPIEKSPLRYAPHTAADISEEGWDRPYTRREGCFPTGVSMTDKYWPSVGRIDNVYGDRNLFCTCAPIDSYEKK